VLGELGAEVQRYQQHVMTLADPYFEGRAPGTAGNTRAAEYIEHYFRKAGLEPAFPGEEGAAPTFRQGFRAGSERKVTEERASFAAGEKTTGLAPGKDFNLLGSSGSGDFEDAPVVFVGYAIEEGSDGYATFSEEDDLTGKVALVLRFEPMNSEGKSRWVEKGWSPASGLDAKLQAVAERGAAAILMVNPPECADPRSKEMMDLKSSIGASRPRQVPVAMVSPETADAMLRASGRGSLLEMRERADEKGEVVELPGVTMSMAASVERAPIMTDNVAGLLPGRGELKDEYIVIGGHYDHVGFGPTGVIDAKNMGKLHPGADDNASGTSGVLMLADWLAEQYGKLPDDAPARSIIFIAFTAEESGLNGSRWFVNHPPVPLESIDLMVNMDMIGRLREDKLDVDGVESAVGFYDWLKPFFDDSGLVIKHGFSIPSNSDHYSFYAKKIPILSLFTGYHDVYHTPGDEAYLINAPGAVRALKLVERIVVESAQREERWEYKPSRRPAAPKEEEKPAEQAAAPSDSPGPVRGNVRFGIAPGDYSDDEPGVLVGDVYDGTPAAAAGIKKGDRMVRWNGKALKDVEGWMPLLSAAKPGDVVEIVVVRDDKEITTKATLTARNEAPK
jgi:hypothetical protein